MCTCPRCVPLEWKGSHSVVPVFALAAALTPAHSQSRDTPQWKGEHPYTHTRSQAFSFHSLQRHSHRHRCLLCSSSTALTSLGGIAFSGAGTPAFTSCCAIFREGSKSGR